MEIAFFLVALVVGVLAVQWPSPAGSACPRRSCWSSAGVAASFLPFVPQVHLEPEVVLLGLLPPLLYSTAITSSLVDFNANRRSILLLSVGLVALHHRRHRPGWCTCASPASRGRSPFALGAVVAPPDAVAATAIGATDRAAPTDRDDPRGRVAVQRRHRAGRAAYGAPGRQRRGTRGWHVAWDFVRAAGGGALIGLVGLPARRAGCAAASPTRVLDVAPVVRDPVRGSSWRREDRTPPASSRSSSPDCCSATRRRSCRRRSPGSPSGSTGARSRSCSRTPSSPLIGLQAPVALPGPRRQRPVGRPDRRGLRCDPGRRDRAADGLGLRRPLRAGAARAPTRSHDGVPPWQFTFLLGWAGMRGVVTLAAAFLIPESTDAPRGAAG